MGEPESVKLILGGIHTDMRLIDTGRYQGHATVATFAPGGGGRVYCRMRITAVRVVRKDDGTIVVPSDIADAVNAMSPRKRAPRTLELLNGQEFVVVMTPDDAK